MTADDTPTGPDVTTRYRFAFAPSYRLAALPFGVTPATTWVELGPDGLRVRFGLWQLGVQRRQRRVAAAQESVEVAFELVFLAAHSANFSRIFAKA